LLLPPPPASAASPLSSSRGGTISTYPASTSFLKLSTTPSLSASRSASSTGIPRVALVPVALVVLALVLVPVGHEVLRMS